MTYATALSRVPYLRAVNVKWAIDAYKVPSEIGESLTLLLLTKTENERLLNKKIPGAEAVLRPKSKQLVSSMDQKATKGSTTKKGGNTGNITVTASVDILAELVDESAEVDS